MISKFGSWLWDASAAKPLRCGNAHMGEPPLVRVSWRIFWTGSASNCARFMGRALCDPLPFGQFFTMMFFRIFAEIHDRLRVKSIHRAYGRVAFSMRAMRGDSYLSPSRLSLPIWARTLGAARFLRSWCDLSRFAHMLREHRRCDYKLF